MRDQLDEKRRERHQVWFGEPSAWHRVWWRVADASDISWVRGVLVALVTWLFMVGMSSFDYYTYRGVPVEDVVVLSVEMSTTETVTCDRFSLVEEPAEVITYRSLTPRQGYPDEFWAAWCPSAEEQPGDRLRLVRTDIGPDHVHPYPLETPTALWTWPLPYALVFGLATAALFFIQAEWRATR